MANQSVVGARDLWLRLRSPWFSKLGRHHVPVKLVSLRSRIRGGQDYLTVIIATAAQFLTLRLIISISTEAICGDSDGPGHAPTLPLCWAEMFLTRMNICLSNDVAIGW